MCQTNPANSTPAAQHANTPSAGGEPLNDNSLGIKNGWAVRAHFPHSRHSFQFHTQGGASVPHWRQQSGLLPPGLKLEDNGVLHGEPTRAREYRFAISVTDNGRI